MKNETSAVGFGDYVGLLRRRWIYLATIFPLSMLLAIYLAYALPAQYRATATIMLEPSSIPAELIQTTVASYATQQIEIVQRRVLSEERLLELIGKIDPYPVEAQMRPKDKAREIVDSVEIERVDPVTLEPLVESNAFSLSYLNPNPKLAAAVTSELAQLFLTYNQRSRSEAATQTRDFLKQQSKAVEETIQQVDKRLAAFKSRYGDALPEAQVRNQAALDRAIADLRAAEQQIRLMEERESLLIIQLSNLSPTLVGVAGDWRTELATLKAQLAEANMRYTPDHPDVKRLKRAIEAIAAKAGTSATGPPPVADNPEYQTVSNQLLAVRRELAALKSNASTSHGQIADYERRLANTPSVELEYAQLVREHEAAQAQYQEIQVKLQSANIAENLETQSRGERFTLIRSAYPPSSPYSPNRLGLILIGFVIGAGLSVGIAALVDSSDPSVRSSRDLTDLTDLAILGAVPVLLNQQDRKRRMWAWGSLSVAYAVLTAMVVISVVRAGPRQDLSSQQAIQQFEQRQ